MSLTFNLSDRDRARLDGVHPDLVRVIERAAKLTPADRPFMVIQGVRSVAEQRRNVRRGVSKTMNSRHLKAKNGYGHAVDIAPLNGRKIPWQTWAPWRALSKIIKKAARIEGVPVEWGGDWKRWRDGPHWQLPWRRYPATATVAEVAAEPAIEERSIADLSRSRTMAGAGAAGGGGLAVMVEPARRLYDAAIEQSAAWSAGDVIGFAVGALIVIAALVALYARWDDAGRPRLREMFGGGW